MKLLQEMIVEAWECERERGKVEAGVIMIICVVDSAAN